MRKRYIVFIQDEWNNNYLMGVYNQLNDSIKDINEHIQPLYNTTIDSLNEYASTFGTCFDQSLDVDEDTSIMIRGFIWFDYSEDEPQESIPEGQLSLFDLEENI